jgi:hypothetical protein
MISGEKTGRCLVGYTDCLATFGSGIKLVDPVPDASPEMVPTVHSGHLCDPQRHHCTIRRSGRVCGADHAQSLLTKYQRDEKK